MQNQNTNTLITPMLRFDWSAKAKVETANDVIPTVVGMYNIMFQTPFSA